MALARSRHFDGDVMQTFAALVDEFGDHRILRFRRIRSSLFATGVPRQVQHRDVDLFQFDRFAEADRETQLLFVEG